MGFIYMGAAVGVLALALIVVLFWRRRRDSDDNGDKGRGKHGVVNPVYESSGGSNPSSSRPGPMGFANPAYFVPGDKHIEGTFPHCHL
jgi:hypothetical protein